MSALSREGICGLIEHIAHLTKNVTELKTKKVSENVSTFFNSSSIPSNWHVVYRCYKEDDAPVGLCSSAVSGGEQGFYSIFWVVSSYASQSSPELNRELLALLLCWQDCCSLQTFKVYSCCSAPGPVFGRSTGGKIRILKSSLPQKRIGLTKHFSL